MVVLNNLDRYQLALDAIRRIPRLADQVEKRDGAILDDHGAPQALHQRAWRRPAGGPRLALERVNRKRHRSARVLALNSGSSSLKFGLYRVSGSRTEVLLSGAAECNRRGERKISRKGFAGARTDLRHRIHFQPTGRDHPYRKTSRRLQDASAVRDRASHRAWRTKAAAALPDR